MTDLQRAFSVLADRLADRLEQRTQTESFSLSARDIFGVLITELRGLNAQPRKPTPPRPERFDETLLLGEVSLEAMQRIGRDEVAERTTLALVNLDALINGYRWLKAQRITQTQRIAQLEAQIEDLRRTFAVVTAPRIRIYEDRCEGNCSRGGDGPPCGKLGCRG